MRLSRIHLKKCILVSLGILLSQNVVLSFQLESSISHSISCLKSAPAAVKKKERENSFVYSFQPLSTPEQSLLDGALERFRKVEGFVSLSVNAQNEIELVTTKNIAEKESTYLVMVSARLYGYIGYQIVE